MKQTNNKYSRIFIILAGLVSFMFAQDSVVHLSIGNLNEPYGTFDVLYDAQEDIYGFQFQVTGVDITSGGGGAAEANGFNTSWALEKADRKKKLIHLILLE
jgi:hypothetical protein